MYFICLLFVVDLNFKALFCDCFQIYPKIQYIAYLIDICYICLGLIIIDQC